MEAEELLKEVGVRLARERLRRDWTQRELALEAGVSVSTVRRLEGGASTQLIPFLRILRALDLLAAFEELLPDPGERPLEALAREQRGAERQRASGRRRKRHPNSTEGWVWGEDR